MHATRVSILLAGLVLGPALGRAGPPPAELAREILRDPAFQKELVPAAAPAPPASGCNRTGPRIHTATAASSRGQVATLLAWVGVGLALGLALIWLAAGLRRRHKTSARSATDAAPQVRGPQADPSLEAIERMAAAGQLAEAIHELLILTVLRLARRNGRPISTWLTSRELTRLLPAGERDRTLFVRLVERVERSWFGGQSVTPTDYALSLQDFMGLTEAARAGEPEGR